jgi:YVTN family beta-propeller protein
MVRRAAALTTELRVVPNDDGSEGALCEKTFSGAEEAALCGRRHSACEDWAVDKHGLVTIMHVDVEGSTELTTRVGDEVAQKVLTETKRVVRDRVEALGGREIDAVGDAMMMTFASTRAAIAGAIGVQEELAARERERPEETLRVRIGLNVGEVLERDNAPFGAAVNAGARVMAEAAGGEIFVSEMVRRLAGTVPGVEYRDRGRHTFKGFDEPWRLYEVVWPGAPPKRSRARARPSRNRTIFAATAVALLIVVAMAAFLLTRSSSGGLSGVRPNSAGVIDPATNRIVAEVPVGIRPGPIAVGGGAIWVGNLDDRNVTRIDPRTRTSNATISLDERTPTAIAVGAGGVWVAHGSRGQLTRVDPQFNRVSATIDVTPRSRVTQSAGLAVGAGSVWAAYGDSTFVRVDPGDVRVVGRSLAGGAPAGIVVAGGSVWVANSTGSSVDRFSPSTFQEGPLGRISVGTQPSGIAYGANAIWVACTGDDVVTRINPATAATTTIPVGDGPAAVAFGEGAVWVANTAGGTVSRIDPETNDVVATIDVGAAPSGIAVGEGFVWVAVDAP